MKNSLDEIGTDRVLFETDYPHPICPYGAEVRQKIDAAFGDLSQQARNQILFSSTAELYAVSASDGPWEGGSAGSENGNRPEILLDGRRPTPTGEERDFAIGISPLIS